MKNEILEIAKMISKLKPEEVEQLMRKFAKKKDFKKIE